MKNQSYRLHKFLRKYGAVRRFKVNVKADDLYTYEELLSEGETDPTVMSGAFVWVATPEGCEYWHRLSMLYWKSFNKFT